jgi:hypothetical protein
MRVIINKVEFSELFDKFLLNKSELTKLTEAIYIHGYRGASKKRHNGVVPIRPVDKQLLKDLNKAILQESNEIQEKYKDCCPIKVVAHVPSGNRLIGYIYNMDNKELGVYILSVSHY